MKKTIVILILMLNIIGCGEYRKMVDKGIVPNFFPRLSNPPSNDVYLKLFEEYKQDIAPRHDIEYMIYSEERPNDGHTLAICYVGFYDDGEMKRYIEFYFEPEEYSPEVLKMIAYHEFAHCANNAQHSDEVRIMNPYLNTFEEIDEQTWQEMVMELITYLGQNK